METGYQTPPPMPPPGTPRGPRRERRRAISEMDAPLHLEMTPAAMDAPLHLEMTPAAMAALPWQPWLPWLARARGPVQMQRLTSTGTGEACCVCLQGMEDGDSLHQLSCGHRFHCPSTECPGVEEWMRGGGTCPLCRQ